MEKILIANRGEIAVRIIRACHDLGLQTVAVYSQADKEALHVLHADEAVCIGPSPSLKSYLHIPSIIAACEVTGADAIHPGYGFLSENTNFATICESCGITFIGPSAASIAQLGDKVKAKVTAKKAGCPTIPGSDDVVENLKDGIKIASKIGFPLMIKAVAGGGGKGIRLAEDEEAFKKHFIAAQTEAQAGFSNPDVYLEKVILNPRHIEVQIIGDQHGNFVHLGERDCSVQRRRQKLIEEAPSIFIDEELRQKMGQAAIKLAKAAHYHSVGTVEFLVDPQRNFYFMEMNTRIQVEHTVTEEVTGIDLVKEQIKVAMGKKLSFKQKDIYINGHAIQFRINAEDPKNYFAPSPGKLEYYLPPGGPHVRIDSACYSGYMIPPYYDSMIAKLIVKAKSREEAIQIAKRALKEFHIGGIKSTIPLHQLFIEDETYVQGQFDLSYVDQLIAENPFFKN